MKGNFILEFDYLLDAKCFNEFSSISNYNHLSYKYIMLSFLQKITNSVHVKRLLFLFKFNPENILLFNKKSRHPTQIYSTSSFIGQSLFKF